MPDAERRRGDDVEPLVGGVLQLADQVVGGARLGQQVEGGLEVALDHHVGRGVEEVAHLAEHLGRLLARTPQRRRGHHRRRGERHDTADQGVGPAREGRVGVGQQRGHDDGLDGGLDGEDLPAVQQHRDRHGQHHHERDLPRPGADHLHQQVATEDAERDTDRHLGDPAQPLAVRRTEGDDGRHRGEERRRVARGRAGPATRRLRPRRRTARSPSDGCATGRAGSPATSGSAPTPPSNGVGLHAADHRTGTDRLSATAHRQGSSAWCNPSIRPPPRS